MLRPNRVPGVGADGVPDDAYLLDVREPDEWAAGHAPGAHHLPMMQIPNRLDEIPADREIVVACRVGARSAEVVNYLLAAGRDGVRNLEGGMIAWVGAGRQIVSEDGGVPQVI